MTPMKKIFPIRQVGQQVTLLMPLKRLSENGTLLWMPRHPKICQLTKLMPAQDRIRNFVQTVFAEVLAQITSTEQRITETSAEFYREQTLFTL